jgi:glycosyltransferase involved in cell wall biosynthesis
MAKDKVLIISGINLFEGGPLTIIKDCLEYVDKYLAPDYKLIALVHKKELFDVKNITLLELPKSRKSWINRIYYEYIYFKKISREHKPFLWLSLHDITPNVITQKLVVYCHNPTPFFIPSKKDIKYSKKEILFSFLYKYLYKINIQKNDYVIVQQQWIKKKFENLYKVKNTIVANPIHEEDSTFIPLNTQRVNIDKPTTFFYPAFPRLFKNFEIICKAVAILEKRKEIKPFRVILTINGSENKYSYDIVEKYSEFKSIEFCGLISREEVFKKYNEVDALIFPSRLETWGLPISEFKITKKPMLVADLPYAKETVGEYSKVNFFETNNADMLSRLMYDIIYDKSNFQGNNKVIEPSLEGWKEIFELILKN